MTTDATSETPENNPIPPEAADLKTAGWWTRMRRKRWFRWTIDISIFLLAFAAISLWQGRHLVGSGEPGPDFVLPDMEGTAHNLADYQGKKTFIVFWAPWCSVCGAESDNISRLKSWMGDDINVISVVLSYESYPKVQEFIDKHGVDYPVLLGTQQVQTDYQINAYPTMYVLDKDGNIDYTVAGYTTTFGMLWRALL